MNYTPYIYIFNPLVGLTPSQMISGCLVKTWVPSDLFWYLFTQAPECLDV